MKCVKCERNVEMEGRLLCEKCSKVLAGIPCSICKGSIKHGTESCLGFKYKDVETNNETSIHCCGPCQKTATIDPMKLGCFICGETGSGDYNHHVVFENLNSHVITVLCCLKCHDKYKQWLSTVDSDNKILELKYQCAHCLNTQEGMSRCSKCKITYYCSKTCQRANWKIHKSKCQ